MTQESVKHLLSVGTALLIRVQGAHHRGDADKADVGADDDGQHHRSIIGQRAQDGSATLGSSHRVLELAESEKLLGSRNADDRSDLVPGLIIGHHGGTASLVSEAIAGYAGPAHQTLPNMLQICDAVSVPWDRSSIQRVFLSHTSDLRQFPTERSFVAAAEAAVTRSGGVIVDMAYFAAQDDSPSDVCRRAVTNADVYVLIAGALYGSLIPDRLNLSYCEFEFDVAGKTRTPRLVFLLDGKQQPMERRQQEFRERAWTSGHLATTADSPENLELQLFHALTRLKDERERLGYGAPRRGLAHEQSEFLLPIRQKAPSALGIERRLRRIEQGSGKPLYSRYKYLRDTLLGNPMLWGPAEQTAGAIDHVGRVLEKLDQLVRGGRDAPTEYELFLAMTAALLHLVRPHSIDAVDGGGSDHSRLPSTVVDLLSSAEWEVINAVSIRSAGNKSVLEKTKQFSTEELIGGESIRPRMIVALCHLADALDEDLRSAGSFVCPLSTLFSSEILEFAVELRRRVSGIRPESSSRIIDIDIRLRESDAGAIVRLGGRPRPLVAALADALAGINEERKRLNNFLPEALSYRYIRLAVKPPPEHRTWRQTRDFILGEDVFANDFTAAFPELLAEPARVWLHESLALIRRGNLPAAATSLARLSMIAQDLPSRIKLLYFYDAACLASLEADVTRNADQLESLLDSGMESLGQWLRILLLDNQAAGAEDPFNAVFRMARDNDLHSLLVYRRKEIIKLLPDELRSAVPYNAPEKRYPGSGGCFPCGTPISTPRGVVSIEKIREGDTVWSVDLNQTPPQFLRTRVLHVRTRREIRCVNLNAQIKATGSQPICTADFQFIAANELSVGMFLLTGSLQSNRINTIEVLEGDYMVYSLTTDHDSHNIVAAGFVCHNGKCGSNGGS